MDFRNQILQEKRIGPLKILAAKAKVQGYSTYSIDTIEKLRRRILKAIEPKPLDQLEDVCQIKTITKLKAMAKLLGMSGYHKYKASDLETLRDSIITFLCDKKPFETKKSSESKKSSEEAPPSECTIPYSKLTTSPIDDFINLKYNSVKGIDDDKCLNAMGISDGKMIGKGAYSKSYLTNVKGTPSVFKIAKFEQGGLGAEAFKWECVITERAGKIGVGPVLVDKGICYNTKGKPSYGIMGLGKCTPLNIPIDAEMSLAELREINGLIAILHENGIVHRDMAERNIMRSGSRFVIIDYGLALAFDGAVPHEIGLFDYAYLAREQGDRYMQLLEEILSPEDLTIITNMNSEPICNYTLEEYTVTYFPIEMLRTLGFKQASLYTNNANCDETAEKLDDQLTKRYMTENIKLLPVKS